MPRDRPKRKITKSHSKTLRPLEDVFLHDSCHHSIDGKPEPEALEICEKAFRHGRRSSTTNFRSCLNIFTDKLLIFIYFRLFAAICSADDRSVSCVDKKTNPLSLNHLIWSAFVLYPVNCAISFGSRNSFIMPPFSLHCGSIPAGVAVYSSCPRRLFCSWRCETPRHSRRRIAMWYVRYWPASGSERAGS